ncbi:hypothetical protein [Nannocystis pusilla]
MTSAAAHDGCQGSFPSSSGTVLTPFARIGMGGRLSSLAAGGEL